MTLVRLLFAALLASLHTMTAAAQSGPVPAETLTLLRRLSAHLSNGQPDSVLALLPSASEQMQLAVRRSADMFVTRAGPEKALVEERWVWRQGARQYWRIIETTGDAPEPVVIRWVIGPAGQIAGLGVNLLSGVPPVDSLVRSPR